MLQDILKSTLYKSFTEYLENHPADENTVLLNDHYFALLSIYDLPLEQINEHLTFLIEIIPHLSETDKSITNFLKAANTFLYACKLQEYLSPNTLDDRDQESVNDLSDIQDLTFFELSREMQIKFFANLVTSSSNFKSFCRRHPTFIKKFPEDIKNLIPPDMLGLAANFGTLSIAGSSHMVPAPKPAPQKKVLKNDELSISDLKTILNDTASELDDYLTENSLLCSISLEVIQGPVVLTTNTTGENKYNYFNSAGFDVAYERYKTHPITQRTDFIITRDTPEKNITEEYRKQVVAKVSEFYTKLGYTQKNAELLTNQFCNKDWCMPKRKEAPTSNLTKNSECLVM